MPNSWCNIVIILVVGLSTAKLSGAVCLTGTCTSSTSSMETGGQLRSLLQQHMEPVLPMKAAPRSLMSLRTMPNQTAPGRVAQTGQDSDPYVGSALIDRSHNLIMGWSARAACTATVTMFFANAGIYLAGEQYLFPWVHDYREAKGTAIKPKLSEMANPNFLKFKIVRNPYTRAVSNFVHQMETNFSRSKKLQALAAEHGLNQSASFRDWLSFVKKVGTRKLDEHSRPQFSAWEEAGGKYDVIMQLESPDFEAKLSQINQKAKCALKFQTMHVSSRPTSFLATVTDHYKFPLDERGRVARPSTEMLYKDVESLGLVRQIYAKDFEAYNYSLADVPITKSPVENQ